MPKQAANFRLEPVIPLNYLIGFSDELEVSYYIDPGFSKSKYLIDTEDKLLVDFYYYPELSRTVRVRPDGYISLPRIGEVKVVGEDPGTLSKKLVELYAEYLARPVLHVDLTEFNVKVEGLKEAISTTSRGQSKRVIVRPDGKISLPYLRDDLVAAGKTILELNSELRVAYREYIRNINVAASLLEAKSYQACVVGDVDESGSYRLDGPTTLLQLISRAGGFTNDANLQQVVIIHRNKDGSPEHTVVDVEGILKRHEPDPLIQQYDVIYVPRAWLADVSWAIKTIWQYIPLRFNYSLNVLTDNDD